MRLTLLGTGTSFGVPQLGCGCAVCRSSDPRDQRARSGAALEVDGTTILIDTPPELRLRLLQAGISRADAVLYTHEHADHVNGIDDLRAFSVLQRRAVPCFGSAGSLEQIRRGFPYIFDDAVQPMPGTSKPRITLHPLAPGLETTVAGIKVLPLAFEHGQLSVMGYRFGDLAYITDAKMIGPAERERLRGLRLLVINALWWRPHPTHLSIDEAIATVRELGVERTLLTHLTHETGHAELAARLPAGIEPAYDGLTVEL
ncbi:MAG TPA: MBL fold metallo-hydrolase [Gemmatimonadales bacterium]|nr:MBL fold metallo-hydrolase [Gemmatimonadales bacterium]